MITHLPVAACSGIALPWTTAYFRTLYCGAIWAVNFAMHKASMAAVVAGGETTALKIAGGTYWIATTAEGNRYEEAGES